MTDDDSVAPQSLREKTIVLVACGGILLLLGLVLGLAVSKRNETPDDVQVGEEQGDELGLIVEGLSPRIISKDTEFVVKARVTNVGFDTLRDVVLSVGAAKLIMPVPAGTTPMLRIDVLPPGESKELTATLKAIEPGKTSITAQVLDGAKRVAAGRYWEIEVRDGDVLAPDYEQGAGLAVRISTFGPTSIDPAQPFELTFVVENSGDVGLADLRLAIRTGEALKALHQDQLDYEIAQLPASSARMLRARFKMDKPVARAQIQVYVHDAAGWVGGVGIHNVTAKQ